MTLRSAGHPGARILFAALLLALTVTAQAMDLLKPFKTLFGPDEVITWQTPGQFVKVVNQDRIKKDRRPAKNSHPAKLPAGQLAAVLASLKLEAGGKAGPVFTQGEVTLLAEKLAEALDKALPEQDVVFAIAGGGDGAATRQTTAGRVFVQGGRLQIIFGDVHGPVDNDASNTSHFTKPHRAGKRKESIERETVIADGPGIGYFTMSDRERTDWVMVDVAAIVAARGGPVIMPGAAPVQPPAAQGVVAPAAATAAPGAAPPITAEQQRQLEERRQMVEEMARLRKQAQEQNPAGGAAPAAAATAATAPAKPAAAGKSLEERLSTLQELHAKKLITDEEYAAKRKALLEEL